MKNTILDSLAKEKQANILEASLLIPLRLSKNILAKSKFFKKNSISNLNLKSNIQLYM